MKKNMTFFDQTREPESSAARQAIIYQSELDYLSRCILDYPDIETGGQLFGFWTAAGVPVVLYAIGPGRNARHNPTSFVQDQDYLQLVGNKLYERYRLRHVGEWHSHHQLGLAHPSAGDVDTMRYGVGKPGFPRMLLCIGNCTWSDTTVNPFIFDENFPGEYSQASWDIVKMESPFRHLADSDLSDILIHPLTRKASHGRIRTINDTVQGTEPGGVHWLIESYENVETMKAFVSKVSSLCPDRVVKTEILDSGEPLIVLEATGVSIRLPYGFPKNSPVLTVGGVDMSTAPGCWTIGEEPLTKSFGRWLECSLPTALGNSK